MINDFYKLLNQNKNKSNSSTLINDKTLVPTIKNELKFIFIKNNTIRKKSKKKQNQDSKNLTSEPINKSSTFNRTTLKTKAYKEIIGSKKLLSPKKARCHSVQRKRKTLQYFTNSPSNKINNRNQTLKKKNTHKSKANITKNNNSSIISKNKILETKNNSNNELNNNVNTNQTSPLKTNKTTNKTIKTEKFDTEIIYPSQTLNFKKKYINVIDDVKKKDDILLKEFRNVYEEFLNLNKIKHTIINNSCIKENREQNTERISKYIIYKSSGAILGKGGFSTVYMALDNKNSSKQYAVKITEKKKRINNDKTFYDYVKSEVIMLEKVRSKYIVPVYEIIDTDSKLYIVMEKMEKGSIFKLIKNNDITDSELWTYARNLICAVEHCHEIAKIIHKDINVKNLLVNEDGIAKLCDFGISEFYSGENDILPVNNGPATYIPPEKKFNENKFYSGKKADIYLLGLTLYHMIYKQPAFHDKDFRNLTLEDYNEISFPESDTNNKKIDIEVINLLKSLLNINPEERPTITEIKKNKWITQQSLFPLPDIIEDTLDYIDTLQKNKENDGDMENIEKKEKKFSSSSDSDEDFEEEEAISEKSSSSSQSSKSFSEESEPSIKNNNEGKIGNTITEKANEDEEN